MDKNDIESNNLDYFKKIKNFGESREILSTGSRLMEHERYKRLTSIGILHHENPTVLDVGCGISNYFSYLKNNGFKGKYIGLDISPDMLKISKKLYPENVYLLGELKYERAKLNNVDYIVSSQTFNRNLKQSDNYYEVKEFIKLSGDIVKNGFTFDLLSNYVDFFEEKHFYYSPELIFKFSKEFFKKVNLLHDMEGFEFTIQIKK